MKNISNNLRNLVLLSLCLILIFQMGCKPAPNKAVENERKSTSDSLYHRAIALHDEAMPKMGKLMGSLNQTKLLVDSLQKLPLTKRDSTYSKSVSNYKSLQLQLENAIQAMNNWMDNFNPDPDLSKEEDLINYFREQAKNAQIMRDSVTNALIKIEIVFPGTTPKPEQNN